MDDNDRRRNPFLVAIWIVGVVSVLFGALAIVASQFYFAGGFGYSDPTPPIALIAAQVAVTIAPSLLIGGIVVIAVALAVSALHRYDLLARERNPVPSEQLDSHLDAVVGQPTTAGMSTGTAVHPPSVDAASPFAPPLIVQGPAARPSDRRPLSDHDRFKRPSTSRD